MGIVYYTCCHTLHNMKDDTSREKRAIYTRIIYQSALIWGYMICYQFSVYKHFLYFWTDSAHGKHDLLLGLFSKICVIIAIDKHCNLYFLEMIHENIQENHLWV